MTEKLWTLHYGAPSIVSPECSMTEEGSVSFLSTSPVPGLCNLYDLVDKGYDIAKVEGFDSSTFERPDHYLRSVGIPRKVVEADFRDLIVPTEHVLASSDLMAFLKSFLRRLLAKYKVQVHRTWQGTVFVSFMELHSPRRAGSLAMFRQMGQTSEESAFALKILGAGGGDGCMVRFTLSSALQARDGRCYSAQIPFDVRFEECFYVRESQPFPPFVRVSWLEPKDGLRQSLVPSKQDLCNIPYEKLETAHLSVDTYDLRQADPSEAAEIEIKIEENQTSKSLMKLEIPFLDSSLKVTGEVKTLNAITYSYRLPGGATYYAFRPKHRHFHYWLTAQ